MFERQRFGHGHQLYPEVLSVPLVVRGLPGEVAGSTIEIPVGIRDILPTLVRAAAGADRDLGEISDRAVLLRPDPDRTHVAQNLLYPEETAYRWAVRRGNWKALYGPDGRAALFDLDTDPAERIDLAEQRPHIVESLRPAFVELESEGTSSVPISESTREALRRLGYGTP
jgi:arylsulfatase A-like enzyme